MRSFDIKYIPEYPYCTVVTSDSIHISATICIADFRDLKAIYHPGLSRFVGVDQEGVLWMLRKEVQMVNGIWIGIKDESIKLTDINPLSCSLQVIT